MFRKSTLCSLKQFFGLVKRASVQASDLDKPCNIALVDAEFI